MLTNQGFKSLTFYPSYIELGVVTLPDQDRGHGDHFGLFLRAIQWLKICFDFLQNCRQGKSCLPLFAIENQLDWLVTSANMADYVFEKESKMAAKIHSFLNQVRCRFLMIFTR